MTVLKSIVACLALANVGYFLWARGIDSTTAVSAPAGQTTLKLASEAPAPLLKAADGGSGLGAPGDAGLLTNVSRCVTVGPFKDVSETSHAASTLRGGGYNPRQRVEAGDVWAGVWVFLPVPGSRSAGDQMLAKLKTAGVDDALEMPGPADAPVISLGLFSDARRAQPRMAQAQTAGYTASIVDRKRSGNLYWIDIDLKPTDGLLNPADLQGEAGHINRLEVKACPPDATVAATTEAQP